jgi:hypothetical protein
VVRVGLFSIARFAGFESYGLRAAETQRFALGYSQPPASRAGVERDARGGNRAFHIGLFSIARFAGFE